MEYRKPKDTTISTSLMLEAMLITLTNEYDKHQKSLDAGTAFDAVDRNEWQMTANALDDMIYDLEVHSTWWVSDTQTILRDLGI